MTREDLPQDLLANPDDDAPRLAYARRLDGQGDPRGEFIRLQIELASLPEADAQRPAKMARERKLFKAHQKAWNKPFKFPGIQVGWRRGFVETVVAADYETFAESAEQLFALAPIQQLCITEAEGPIDLLADCPFLARLQALCLGESELSPTSVAAVQEGGLAGLGPEEIRTLLASRHLPRLRMLSIRAHPNRGALGDQGARALAAAPKLAQLTSLDLSTNCLGDVGARALAESPHLKRLTALSLEFNDLTDRGVEALARSPNLGRLTILNLYGNQIGDRGAQALAGSSHLGKLRLLELGANDGLGQAGARKLQETFGRRPGLVLSGLPELVPNEEEIRQRDEQAQGRLRETGIVVQRAYRYRCGKLGVMVMCSPKANPNAIVPHLRDLAELVELNGLTKVTDRHLAEIGSCTSLQDLGIQGARITDAGLHSLEQLSGLQSLSLDSNQITAAGLEVLTRFPKLKYLVLHGTDIGDEVIQHLKRLGQLINVNLSRTALTDAGLERLRRWRPKLQNLWLERTRVTSRGLDQLQAAMRGTTIWR
jgi:uncharacterized protein (TIGR02996 family)